jgi:hypothetical protein
MALRLPGSYVAAVDSPRITGRRRERGADEAVALGLGEKLAERLFGRCRIEADLEADVQLDEGIATVAFSLRHDAMSVARALGLDPCVAGVVAETRQRAADERGEDEVLGAPLAR